MRGLVTFPQVRGIDQPTLSPLGLDQLFGRLLEHPSGRPGRFGQASPAMRLEVLETPEALIVRAELPGVDPAGLDVRLSGRVLELSGEKARAELEGAEPRHDERWYGPFKRTLQLPCAIDPDGVEAEHRHGVITITLRKAEAAVPRKIEVRSGD